MPGVICNVEIVENKWHRVFQLRTRNRKEKHVTQVEIAREFRNMRTGLFCFFSFDLFRLQWLNLKKKVTLQWNIRLNTHIHLLPRNRITVAISLVVSIAVHHRYIWQCACQCSYSIKFRDTFLHAPDLISFGWFCCFVWLVIALELLKVASRKSSMM